MEYTESIRKELPNLFQKYMIKSVLDVPCGDFNWIRDVLKHSNIKYMGGDIVPELISELRRRFETESISFSKTDITTDPLPYADLLLVRDLFCHLSGEDKKRLLIIY